MRSDIAIVLAMLAVCAAPSQAEIRLESRISSPRASVGAAFGASLAADGPWLVVGSPGEDEDARRSGAAYIFHRTQGQWVEVDRLREAVPTKGAEFGMEVAIDRDTIVVSAPDAKVDGVERGAVYVYERVGTSWVEVAKLVAPEEKATKFGREVATSKGRIAVASFGPRDENRIRNGAVYTFHRDLEWRHESTLREDEPDPFESAGFGLGLSLRGSLLAAGSTVIAEGRFVTQNVVNLFKLGEEGWVRLARMVEPKFDRIDRFGGTTLLGGGQVLIGVGTPSRSESVAVFDRRGRRLDRLRPGDRKVFPGVNNFGRALAKKGRVLIIGGQDSFSRGDAGSAYVFERRGGEWTEMQKVQMLDADFSFGESVAVTGTSILVGAAARANGNGVRTGIVYSFRR